MQDIQTQLKRLKRPPLLVRAARAGQQEYLRKRHLRQVLPEWSGGPDGKLLMQLLSLESDYNALRTKGVADYQPRHHVMILIALQAEARAFLLPAAI